MHDAIGARVFALMTLIYRRGMLTDRDWPGDADQAVALSRKSLASATELGLDELANLAASDLAESERRGRLSGSINRDAPRRSRNSSARCDRQEFAPSVHTPPNHEGRVRRGDMGDWVTSTRSRDGGWPAVTFGNRRHRGLRLHGKRASRAHS